MVGQNRRYGSDVTDAVIVEALTRPEPISLTEQERGNRVTSAEEPLDVEAWVRFPEAPVKVRARALAWTARAVLVEFTLRDGRTRRSWVWASAVDRR